MNDLQYPIGKFAFAGASTAAQRAQWIDQVAELPGRLRAAAAGLGEAQLDTPYRPGGWTVRQVVHHLADSHINSYVRFRLALTEAEPVVKPYQEAQWAELSDARTAPIEPSLALLDSLHQRWVWLLRGFGPAEFARAYQHPEDGTTSLERALAIYAWHGRHHTAHITALRERMGWR